MAKSQAQVTRNDSWDDGDVRDVAKLKISFTCPSAWGKEAQQEARDLMERHVKDFTELCSNHAQQLMLLIGQS